MIAIRRLATTQPDFEAQLAELLAFESVQDPAADDAVAAILADVKALDGRAPGERPPASRRLEAALGRDFAERLVTALSTEPRR